MQKFQILQYEKTFKTKTSPREIVRIHTQQPSLATFYSDIRHPHLEANK